MKKKGFTLVELLAVIAILALLVLLVLPRVIKLYKQSQKNSFLVECKEIIETAKKQWFNEHASNPSEKVYSRCNDGTCSVVLDMTGRENIEYYVKLNQKGEIQKVYITDGVYQYIEDNGEILNNINAEDEDELLEEVQEVVELSDHAKIKISENKVVVNDQDITAPSASSGNNTLAIPYKCIRATSLHTEVCRETVEHCKGSGYTTTGKMKTTTITYGKIGTRGKLEAGDAFDCDVNGDRKFDSETERFYYVSEYYDTDKEEFVDDYVALIYYANVSNGSISNTFQAYDSEHKNYLGPRTAVAHLPSIRQWSNIRLKTKDRQIFAGEKNTKKYNYRKTAYGDLGVFSYKYNGVDRAARLLTVHEVIKNCGDESQKILIKTDELGKCIFLFENTKFAYNDMNKKPNNGFWLETVNYKAGNNNTQDAITVNAKSRNFVFYRTNNQASDGAKLWVRPAIDVKISDIEF